MAKITQRNFLYICKVKTGIFMVQPQTTTIPNTGSGTINIHINNPSVGAGASMPQYPMPYPYPVYYPYYAYPANYYMGNMGGVNQNMTVNGIGGYPYGNGYGNDNSQKNFSNTNSTVTNRTEEKQKQREIVVLTDNYVKNLENYLKSNNIELRKTAVKEILMRFKEDKSRMNNPSLTALLNIALQDPNGTVRSVAMTTLEAGYARGDAQTEQILRGLQTQKTNYASDAVQASDGLLQMSKTKALVPDNSFYKDYPVTKTKTTERSVENAG